MIDGFIETENISSSWKVSQIILKNQEWIWEGIYEQ